MGMWSRGQIQMFPLPVCLQAEDKLSESHEIPSQVEGT